MTARLTQPQRHMLALLREQGPLDCREMRYGFGSRQWTRVFHALERKKLAWFDYSDAAIKTAKHYTAV